MFLSFGVNTWLFAWVELSVADPTVMRQIRTRSETMNKLYIRCWNCNYIWSQFHQHVVIQLFCKEIWTYFSKNGTFCIKMATAKTQPNSGWTSIISVQINLYQCGSTLFGSRLPFKTMQSLNYKLRNLKLHSNHHEFDQEYHLIQQFAKPLAPSHGTLVSCCTQVRNPCWRLN